VLDPFIQDTTSWATFTGTQVTAATSGVPVNMPGPAGILLSKATAQSVLTRNFQTSPGEVYYLSAYVASPTTTGYAIRLMMQFIDPTGAQGDASGTHVGWAAAITLTAPAVVNTWQKIEGFVTVPAGVAFGRARIVSETGSAVAGSWYATNFVCRRARRKPDRGRRYHRIQDRGRCHRCRFGCHPGRRDCQRDDRQPVCGQDHRRHLERCADRGRDNQLFAPFCELCHCRQDRGQRRDSRHYRC
jgi:hypothetical protein